MESDFEKDIERALQRLRRQELKAQLRQTEEQIVRQEAQFEQDVTDATRLAQRSALKDRLRALEEQASASDRIGEPVVERPTRSIGNYWRYAAAASVILIIGLGLYVATHQSTIPTGSPATIAQRPSAKQDQPSINPAERPSEELAKGPTPTKSTPIQPLDSGRELALVELTIKQEEQLGFAGSDKKRLWVRQQIGTRGGRGVRYRLNGDTLLLSASRQQAVRSVVAYQNQRYVRIGNQFYRLSPTTTLRSLEPVNDETLRTELERIDFQDE